jgi:protein-histidine pros-kinase
MNLLVKFNLILLLVFCAALLPAGYVSYQTMQKNAREQVTANARIMMETAVAVRSYTVKQVKPLVEYQLAEKFIPQTVPAYSATEIFNYLRQTNPDYSYKEATLNPTNPRDRTVEWESDVVNAFRNDQNKKEIVGERSTSQGRSLFLSHPIRITDEKCLVCHSTPENAPASMIRMYGPNNGFGWKLNEVIGAQVVSVPMSVPLKMANDAMRALITSLLIIFIFTFVVMNLLLHFIVVRPIRRLASMADSVSLGNFEAEEVVIKSKDEVGMLANSFSRMKISLHKAISMLEDGN